jgi:hypothetical protein
MRRFCTSLVAVFTVLLAIAGTASAAHRRVPFGTFGTVLNYNWGQPMSASELNSQMGLMASSGVEAVRTDFAWSGIEPGPGTYTWSNTDSIVAAAASHGLQVLPIIEFTPRWASSNPNGAYLYFTPSNPATYGQFLTALIDRYGPKGSFWAAHPKLARDPIRAWQIWDEPAGTKYDWRSAPWPSKYTTLLKTAYQAVHRADPGATVVTGAVVALNGTNLTQWAETSALYRAGFKRYFDVLAVNAFTGGSSATSSVNRSLEIVARVRQVMRAHGDGRKPIWITEVTWTAAVGRIPPSEYAGFETTAAGQAQRLADYFSAVATRHPEGIQRAFWYDWFSSYENVTNTPTFEFSGLTQWRGPGTRLQAMPVLSRYASVVAKFEGCRKTANARRCR